MCWSFFLPRFEEALLVLHQTEKAYLLMGNENLNKAEKARIPAIPIHIPHFSLQNQPMQQSSSPFDLMKQADFSDNQRIGILAGKFLPVNMRIIFIEPRNGNVRRIKPIN